jgi:quinol monooxygenase YgiN
MSEQVAWCVELAILPGQLDGFLELTAEMVKETAKEPGVLTYQRFVTADAQIVHAVERFESSDAALGHLRTFRDKFGERFSSVVTRRRFTVYGRPSAELKGVLDGFGAVYLQPW